MNQKELSIAPLGYTSVRLRTPVYPFPGITMIERIIAAAHLFTLDLFRLTAQKDLDLRVDMTPIEERLE